VDNPTNPSAPTTQQRKERPPVYLKGKRAYQGTGRRKTAVARVYLTDGTGQITVNGRGLEEFFTEQKDRNAVVGPLAVIDMRGRIDATIKVKGGGITGQAGAACQGVARALKTMFGLDVATQPPAEGQAVDENIVNMAKKLRDSGYLTRDGRMKERKKYGRKGARKAFQFSKR
jgi:small subunit ribosomal protein S9